MHLEGGEGSKTLKDFTGLHLVKHQTESETGEEWELMLSSARCTAHHALCQEAGTEKLLELDINQEMEA